MSTNLTTKYWLEKEASSFIGWNPLVVKRLEEGILKSILQFLKIRLEEGDNEPELELPWGTFKAEKKVKGETGNINLSWEPSTAFLKVLNTDLSKNARNETLAQEKFDDLYIELFTEYVMYGCFNHDDPNNQGQINKGIRIENIEAYFMLNSYAMNMADIARDKQREDKILRIEVDKVSPHGTYNFEFDEDKVKVTFVASKVAKQLLKNDNLADENAEILNRNFTPVTEEEGTRKMVIRKGAPVGGDSYDPDENKAAKAKAKAEIMTIDEAA